MCIYNDLLIQMDADGAVNGGGSGDEGRLAQMGPFNEGFSHVRHQRWFHGLIRSPSCFDEAPWW